MLFRNLTFALVFSVLGCSTSIPEASTPDATVTRVSTVQAQADESSDARTPSPGDGITATVISVGDGDTLRVKTVQGEKLTIRAGCIDSPERLQQGGREATEQLKEFLPVGSNVTVRPIEEDRYGRLVAEVYRDGRSINLAMVVTGAAVVYRRYLDGCAADRDQYLAAESQAKEQRLGFWGQENPILPWDFRRGKRGSKKASPDPVTPAPSKAADPLKEDYDCSDFASQAQSQAILDQTPGSDPHKLDRDSDRVACESLS